jgi:hypothetical protein
MLCHLIASGELPAIRKGKRSWRIRLEDLYGCLLRRMDEEKLRNPKLIEALLEAELEENRAPHLTRWDNSTIYSTRPSLVDKGEQAYDEKQKPTEVRQ